MYFVILECKSSSNKVLSYSSITYHNSCYEKNLVKKTNKTGAIFVKIGHAFSFIYNIFRWFVSSHEGELSYRFYSRVNWLVYDFSFNRYLIIIYINILLCDNFLIFLSVLIVPFSPVFEQIFLGQDHSHSWLARLRPFSVAFRRLGLCGQASNTWQHCQTPPIF